MIKDIKFLATDVAPNPKEITHWVDLNEDPTGGVIKTFDGKEWNKIDADGLTEEEKAKLSTINIGGESVAYGFKDKSSIICYSSVGPREVSDQYSTLGITPDTFSFSNNRTSFTFTPYILDGVYNADQSQFTANGLFLESDLIVNSELVIRKDDKYYNVDSLITYLGTLVENLQAKVEQLETLVNSLQDTITKLETRVSMLEKGPVE